MDHLAILAGITDWMPWYSWVCLALLIVVVVVYKFQKGKQM